jgi:hypothetical protein
MLYIIESFKELKSLEFPTTKPINNKSSKKQKETHDTQKQNVTPHFFTSNTKKKNLSTTRVLTFSALNSHHINRIGAQFRIITKGSIDID